MLREHLFITTKHFENCHRFQIFGVGKTSINQFGLVNGGDKIFFLSKDNNLVFGPYEVMSEIFYNDEIIWQEKNGIDAYPYRVGLKSNKLYSIDVNIFSQIIEENRVRIDSGDLGQKSVFTLLPKDIGIFENLLKERGGIVERSIEFRNFEKTAITIELAINKGFTEPFLEFFLLKDFNKFFNGENFLLYNQFRVNLLGSKIDIIAVSESMILVLELKKGTIKEKDLGQFRDYINWVENNKLLLERFFKKDLSKARVKSMLIGKGIQKKLPLENIVFTIKSYSLENNKLTLLDL